MIRPEDFGAKGDGRADDTRALQAACDRADGACVLLTGREYLTSGTVFVPSGITLQGFGAVIRARQDDEPILASQAWGRKATLRGHTRIAGLRLLGTGRGAHQDGVVLHDFWSELADLEIVDVGGRGVVLTAADRGGAAPASTLVENRVRRCIVRDSIGTAFALGEPANGKLTDGELSDCIGALKDGSQGPIVSVGHAAGWTLRNLHTYGGRPNVAIEVRQAYFTRVSGVYCEGFVQTGLSLPQIQTHVAVADVQIIADAVGPDAAFVTVSGHRDFADPRADFTNVCVSNLGEGDLAVLTNVERKVAVGGTRIAVAGRGAPHVRPGDLQSERAGTGSSIGPGRTFSWTGRAPQSVRIASRPARDSFAESYLITLTGRSSDGGLSTQFAGTIQWSHAAPDAHAVLVDLLPFGTPAGFQQFPEASFEHDGEQIVLVLRFTPVASGPGQLNIR